MSYPAQPGYQPAYPGHGAYDAEPRHRSNPIAGILLIIGAIAGLLACLLPNSDDELPIVAAFDLFDQADLAGDQSWKVYLVATAPIVLIVGSVLALMAGLLMFAARPHRGAAALGIIGSLLMLAAPLLMLVALRGSFFDDVNVRFLLMLLAWLPAMIGAFAGMRR